jgi:hypothetical protein
VERRNAPQHYAKKLVHDVDKLVHACTSDKASAGLANAGDRRTDAAEHGPPVGGLHAPSRALGGGSTAGWLAIVGLVHAWVAVGQILLNYDVFKR